MWHLLQMKIPTVKVAKAYLKRLIYREKSNKI